MRNTLTIEKGDTCVCSCIDSIADNTNTIFIFTQVGDVSNPKLRIYVKGSLTKTVELETNTFNLVEIPSELFVANTVISFRYSDDDYVGENFTINFPASLVGTLSVKRVSEYVYTAKYTPTGGKGEAGLTKEEIVNLIYPIGSIFIGVNNINPSTFLGGTWEEWGSGKVPVGVNASETEFNSVEKTGGEKTHTLITTEIPSHTHGLNNHTHSFRHTHTTPATNISGGQHTHATTATQISDALQVDSVLLKWRDSVANGSNGSIRSSGDKPIKINIPSLPIPWSGEHTHTVPAMTTASQNTSTTDGNSGNTTATGSGTAHNNLQPYITCYMWKRTA